MPGDKMLPSIVELGDTTRFHYSFLSRRIAEMLVLSRKENEKIVIGSGEDAITLTVVKIDRNHVRIGIDAKSHIAIMRAELLMSAASNLSDGDNTITFTLNETPSEKVAS